MLHAVQPADLVGGERGGSCCQAHPRHKEVDQVGADFDQRAPGKGQQFTQAAGVLCGDGALGQFGLYVPGKLAQHLTKGQVGIALPGLSIALPNGDNQFLVFALSAAGKLGRQRGLAAACFTCYETDEALTNQRPLQESVEALQLAGAGNKYNALHLGAS